SIEMAGGWGTLLEGPAREALERSVLPGFLQAQRWFGGKARRVEAVRLADWGDFPGGAARAVLVLLDVEFAERGRHRYFWPMGVTTGPAARRMTQELRPWVIARLSGPGGEAVLHDALADDATCAALLAAIGAGQEFATRKGRIHALPTAALAALRGNA